VTNAPILNGNRQQLPGGAGGGPGVLVTKYVKGDGSDETTALNNAVTAAFTLGVPLVGAPITVTVTGTIDMRGQRLTVIGNNMVIRRTTFTGPIVLLGGTSQNVSQLFVTFSGQATLAQTAAAGFVFYQGFQCTYDNLNADLCNISFYLAQAGYLGSTTNTLFSCTLSNWFANGWTDVAFDMQAWPAGGASNTGNNWSNFYFHNNYFGANAACNGYMRMQDHDEGNFSQVNCEWGNPAGDAVYVQRCKNMNWISMHFEGLQITSAAGDVALFRAYENGIHTIQGFTFTNATVINSANNKSLFRCTQGGTAPMKFDVTGVAVRSLTNASANNLSVINVDTTFGTTMRGEFKNVTNPAADGLVGAAILGDATATMVRRYNADYRGGLAETKPAVTGAKLGNAALTSLMTTLATLGIVTDSTT
jgi:hypothetical protein